MQTITEYPGACTTINNMLYVFNLVTGRLIQEYPPGQLAAADWVEEL